jgi:hypothetical protein
MHNRNGATARIPIASPVHHTTHAPASSSVPIAPEATSVVAPTVALIVMLASAPKKTMASASRWRSS